MTWETRIAIAIWIGIAARAVIRWRRRGARQP